MTNSINCIVIDDDPYAIELITAYIGELPNLKLKQSYLKPLDALPELMVKSEPTLVFLDIDMPNFSGIQLAEELKNTNCHVIFTTGHSKYAVEAFEVRAKHFLTKPMELSKFVKVVNQVIAEFSESDTSFRETADAYYIRTGERSKLTRVLKRDIIYIQGAINYVDFFLEKKRHTVYMTLKEMAARLNKDSKFYQVHKSYIINADYIDTIVGNTIHLYSNHSVTMAGKYRDAFLAYLDQHTLISDRLKAS